MKRVMLCATAALALVATAACHKTGSNAGKDLSNPGQSAPVNAAQDVAALPVGVGSAVSTTDAQTFVNAATMGNMYEVDAGKIAARRATSPEVKALANMMVTDHSAMLDKLKDTLKNAGATVTVPAGYDQRHQGLLDNLKAAGDADFDLAYLHQQLAAHIETLATLKTYADRGDNAALQAFAASGVAPVQHHLDEVKRIGGDKLTGKD